MSDVGQLDLPSHWSIGTCAVGGPPGSQSDPTPGATSILRVTTTTTWKDADEPSVIVCETLWPGHTADDLRRHWVKRAKDAAWRHTMADGAMVVECEPGQGRSRRFEAFEFLDAAS